MVGGCFEAVCGVVLAAGSSPTVAGVAGGGLIAAHGLDQAQAGFRQMLDGGHVSSLTSQGLQALGLPPLAADLADAGLSLAGGGASLLQGGRSLATHAADPLAEGLSLFEILKRVEIGSQALKGEEYTRLGGPRPPL